MEAVTQAKGSDAIFYSIVIPVYNEAEVLPALYDRLTRVLEGLNEPYEIIFVNDGSQDDSILLLRDFQARDERIKFLSFSRNFGHQIAITAGLDYSSGQAAVVMDADLQDPPEVIPQLIEQWRKGYDIVFAVRATRQGEGLFKRATAAIFYRLFRRMTTTAIPLDAGDFRLMSRRAVEALQSIRERNSIHQRTGGLDRLPADLGHLCQRCAGRQARRSIHSKRCCSLPSTGFMSFSLIPLQLASYLGF